MHLYGAASAAAMRGVMAALRPPHSPTAAGASGPSFHPGRGWMRMPEAAHLAMCQLCAPQPPQRGPLNPPSLRKN